MLALGGCLGEAGDSNTSPPLPIYSLSATVSGLGSSGLVLMVNATAVNVPSGVSYQALASALPPGAGYSVVVQAQPVGETCTVANGSGTIGSANVTNVAVTCSKQSYSVGGTISGLVSSGLVLANGSDTLSVNSGASSFTMPTAVTHGSAYAVTVQTQPMGLTCSVSNGTGTMGAAAVTNIAIRCSANTYTVSGTVSGLTAGGLTLLDNGADATPVDATQFTMHTPVAYGSAYAITVQASPPELVCSVSNGSGTMGAGNVTNVSITCGSNFTLLHSFAGGSGDGATPYHSLIQANDGNFYGTTIKGGASDDGAIFKITPSGTETVLYFFLKGSPYAGLIQGNDGNFYGTTQNEGASSRGTIFEVTPSGTETVLYSFPAGGSDPYTGVIQGSDGNFYGTTGSNGASDDGTVFEFTPGGTETVLHAFPKVSNGDGQTPYAGLIQGSDGNFYGTTYNGGTHGDGTVFEVTPGGTETVLYSFAGGSDGEHPYGGVIQGKDGNFYGTTYNGGANGLGTVFELTLEGTETILYSFAGSDGANPQAGLTQGSDGNFYGATYLGGANGLGTVFEITPSGTETVLHSFAESDGANPSANLVQGSDGNLYGSTVAGGTGGSGTFFRIVLQ